MGRLPCVGSQHAQPTHQHRHLRPRQRELVSAVDQQLGDGTFQPRANIVAETIGQRFHHLERRHVGLLL
ncbi:hypothetical protein D3C71_1776530 [compost metagenome]